MCTVARMKWAAALLVFGAHPAATGAEEIAVDPSRPDIVSLLSEALASFDDGSARLKTDPNGALEAFRRAREKFQAVVDAGVENGGLHYNLGNTHLRLGDIGAAIAQYRRAERLIPGDEQLRANLRFARKLCRDQIRSGGERTLLQTVFFWHYRLALRTRLQLALGTYGAFWLIMLLRAILPRVRLTYPAIVSLVVWVTLGVSVAVGWPSSEVAEGVLTGQEVIVRKGNGDGYDPQFKQPLHQGVEFSVLEQRREWVHIELADGKSGWIKRADAELF